jgi:hypothetical protein
MGISRDKKWKRQAKVFWSKAQNTEVKTRQGNKTTCVYATPNKPRTHQRYSASLLHFSSPLSIFPPYTVAQAIRVLVYPQQTFSDPIFHETYHSGNANWKSCASKTAGGNGGPVGETLHWGIRKDGEAVGTQASPFLDSYVLHRVVHPTRTIIGFKKKKNKKAAFRECI